MPSDSMNRSYVLFGNVIVDEPAFCFSPVGSTQPPVIPAFDMFVFSKKLAVGYQWLRLDASVTELQATRTSIPPKKAGRCFG
jgi:hypothetical protein